MASMMAAQKRWTGIDASLWLYIVVTLALWTAAATTNGGPSSVQLTWFGAVLNCGLLPFLIRGSRAVTYILLAEAVVLFVVIGAQLFEPSLFGVIALLPMIQVYCLAHIFGVESVGGS
jgi:hypothetical protein